MLSLTSVLSADSGSSLGRVGQLTDEAQAGERLASGTGVDRGEALHARGQREEQRQCLPVPHLTDDRDVGCHAKEAGHELAKVHRGRSGRPRRVCMLATFGSGTSASNTSSATTTRSGWVELGRAA